MRLIKFEHSCFAVTLNGKTLVIDPGAWTENFVLPENVVAVVVTHEHADHFDQTKLNAILEKNPGAVIYAPLSVTSQIQKLQTIAVDAGDTINISEFSLKFIGRVHSTIHEDFHPEFQNVGVIINDSIYHPGDSLALPEQPIKVLSLPIAAPWAKVSDTMDFMLNIKPEIAFPSHDAFLNKNGIDLYDRWHKMAADKHGISYQRLTEPVEIDG